MSLQIVIAQRAEQDMALQHRWYLENAEDEEVAERYLMAVDQTIQRLAAHPELGLRRHFQSSELAGIRSFQAARPFHKHLIFYQAEDHLSIERIMHGARDLPRRLLEEPEG
ncbi:type II toxin-antitoxin system RelE/ParE family toxin [Prosthecobacter sp.]|uniref:type II toxin-antitoxin system RelE/ParE family toxin n=1 Tax=Prosthecobacter sp. TaxID=1965333 RepID=UPI003784D8DD